MQRHHLLRLMKGGAGRPPSVECFGGSCSSTIVLTSSLNSDFYRLMLLCIHSFSLVTV